MNLFRHTARRLGHSLPFTLIAVLTLAIGIAANTAIFSVVNGVLLKPLPYPESDRLVGIWFTAPGINITDLIVSPAAYYTFREESRTLQDIGLWRSESVSVTGLSEPEQVRAMVVTDGTLPLLRLQPAVGRWFSKLDDSPGGAQTVILAHGYWQRRFGGDPAAIGRRLMVDGKPREIIGVLPRGFRFSDLRPDVVLPLQLNRSEVFVGNFSYYAIARLKPGFTVAQTNEDVARMLPLMLERFRPAPGMNNKMLEAARIAPNVRLFKRDVTGDIGSVLWVLMGTVGIVLLIACANVANLLLVKADGRQQEFAIRSALGASQARIAREMLAESLALGVLGGVAGLGLSYAVLQLLVAIGPSSLPRLDEVGLDASVLAFTFLLSIVAGFLFGVIPVLKYAGPRLALALRSGGRTMSDGKDRNRTRGALVVVQVALALVLLISSGLMIRSLSQLKGVKPGFTDPDQLLTVRVSIPGTQVATPEAVARMFEAMVDKVSSVAGVTSVALTSSVTMDGENSSDPIFAEGRVYADSTIPPLRRYKHVSPGTFQTLGNRILAGRDLTWTDVYQTRNVVLVSENLARELWGSAVGAIGKRIRENPKGTWREVIGVVGDEHDDGVHQKPPTIVYWPIMVRDLWDSGVEARRTLAFVIRSDRTGTGSFLQEVQRSIWSVNPNVPIAGVRTVRQIGDASMARTSFTLVMLSIAAGTALLLGVIGIYGVISYSISQRTREIGIRMALGASHANVQRLFVRQGLMLTGIGILCGFAAAVPLTRLMTSLLYGTSPLDGATYISVACVLMFAALVAAYLPARRATVIEPLKALRFE
ncbi:MAG: ABC transporter permease [Bryobacteraceae bacterium]|nr:ABC transporter permease [Bryobacteraceae bacterium]